MRIRHACVALAAVCGLLAIPAAMLPASAAATPVRGIDVSEWQHPYGAHIDWRQVAAAGYRFVFIKDTEGTFYANPWYQSDARAAEAAGMKVSAYHFADPAQSWGRAQANYAVDHGLVQRGMGRPVLDIEKDPYGQGACYGRTRSGLVAWIAAFLRQVHALTGWWPAINTMPYWWSQCTGNSRAFGNRLLWIDDHRAGITRPVLPAGWTTWRWWQYSITGHVPGISAVTDLDTLNPAAAS